MDADLDDLPPTEPVKRGRGRPKGSRNRKPVQTPPEIAPDGHNALTRLDFKYADPETLAARNMSLIDHAQQALRHELGVGFQADGKSIHEQDIAKIVNLCAALDRAAAGMLRVQKAAQELQKNLTPAQTLEKAILKIMGQDTATQKQILRRIEKGLLKLEKRIRTGPETATDAIAELTK